MTQRKSQNFLFVSMVQTNEGSMLLKILRKMKYVCLYLCTKSWGLICSMMNQSGRKCNLRKMRIWSAIFQYVHISCFQFSGNPKNVNMVQCLTCCQKVAGIFHCYLTKMNFSIWTVASLRNGCHRQKIKSMNITKFFARKSKISHNLNS